MGCAHSSVTQDIVGHSRSPQLIKKGDDKKEGTVLRQNSGPTAGKSLSLEKNTVNSTNLTVFERSET